MVRDESGSLDMNSMAHWVGSFHKFDLPAGTTCVVVFLIEIQARDVDTFLIDSRPIKSDAFSRKDKTRPAVLSIMLMFVTKRVRHNESLV